MAEYDADVIIVGSGSLGSLAGLQLARAGKSVLILEAGPEIPDWKVTQNYRTSARRGNLNDPFGDVPYAPNSYTPGYFDNDMDVAWIPGTLRVAGGTSRHWTGVAWRLLPEEMRMKTLFGIGRDWPFDYDELEPYYTEAEYQIGVNGDDDADQSGRNSGSTYPPRSKPYPLPPEVKPYPLQRFQMRTAPYGYQLEHAPNVRLSRPYAGRPACMGNNVCNPNCPIGAKHSGIHDLNAAREAGADFIANAVVVKLEQDGKGKITSVSYLDPEGHSTTLRAKVYVIAAHGFETAKLLLMNNLANSSGMVGRNLMVHPTLAMSFYADEPLWVGRGQYLHGANLQHRLRDDRGQTSGSFAQFMNHNPAREITASLFEEGGFIGKDLDEALRYRAAHQFSIQLLLEDLPEPSNTIKVNTRYKDAIGQPGITVHYRLQDYSRSMLDRALDDYANWAQAMNAIANEAPGDTWYNQHHIMGTVIMGNDPKDSVVDRDLRCHDHDNLYLVTTGVFPSSSCVNPTLTGAALAVRAGQHIVGEV